MESRQRKAALIRLWLDGRLDHWCFLQAMLPHLTESCTECTVPGAAEVQEGLTREDAIRGAIDHVLEMKARAPADRSEEIIQERLATLFELPKDQRIPVIERSRSRYGSPQLALRLLELSRSAATRDPEESESLSMLAEAVSLKVQSKPSSRAVGVDLEALAIALQGNAKRLLGEYQDARGMFERSRRSLAAGSGDLVTLGEVLGLEASLLMDLRQFREARRAARRAVRLFRLCEDDHKAGRTLVTLSLIYSLEGRSRDAVAALHQAEAALDFDREPHLSFNVSVNLALFVAEAGDPLRGQEILRTTSWSGQSPRTRLNRGRVEARIEKLLGRTSEAIASLAALRDEYARLGDAPNTAMVSLDLAVLYAEQGRSQEVQRLTEEALPLLQEMAIPKEIWATLLLFKQAVEAEKAGLKVLQEIRDTIADPRGWRGRVVPN